ncbi:MAG TPA: helix-hairpin-helix domain-containing protein [Casimicrobiaceae bacterium]|nr:helix-hairpin-helix domain-containing protein [Casimicrobiaceae bacterium]
MAHSAKRTIDHDEIRRWVDARGGKPAHVKRTSEGKDPGVLRIDYPGYAGEDTLEAISWDEWFDWFEKNNLAFLYQDEKNSRFSKLVRRNDSDENESASSHPDQRTSAGRYEGGGERKRWSSKTEAVTINDATAEELDALWGVGPQIAQRIIAYRRQHGRIKGEDDLVAIDGIDGATARNIAQQVSFG